MKNFIRVFKRRIVNWNKESFNLEKELKIINKSIDYMDKIHNISESGDANLSCFMEESAELLQRVSKYKRERNEKNRLLLIEEMADVSIGLNYLLVIAGIKESEILLARDIKIKRLDTKMNKNIMK
jgi:NTP pyrophosphatase (non-canonical NTP hydrolase)